MTKVARAVLVLVCLLSAPARAGLVLNEFLAGPSSDWNGSGEFSSRDDEWVEVVNDGGGTLDISAYFLTDAGDTPRFRFSGSLAAGARLVVYGSDAYDWERAEGFPAFGLSLGNSGDEVKLWQIVGPDTTLVDNYAYPAHAAAADRAVGRSPDATGGWGLFDGLNPYTGSSDPQGTGCVPTPGQSNECSTTPTRETTWGRIKATYR